MINSRLRILTGESYGINNYSSRRGKANLRAEAGAQGQDIKTFVETILKTTISPSVDDLPAPVSVRDEEFEADMLAFAEETDHLPPYSGTYSRADIYFDHD